MGDLVRVFRFLLRYSAAKGRSRRLLVLVVGASIVSGLASTALVVLVASRVSSLAPVTAAERWRFFALCAALPVARFSSQLALAHLTQNAVFQLRMRLTRQILGSRLRHLETIGAHRLLATLTQDVAAVTQAMVNLPLNLMYATVIAGCLGYMGYLAPLYLAAFVGVLVLGVVSYQLPVSIAQRSFARYREHWDDLLKHIRGLVEGTKELKIHRPRREAFLNDLFESAAEGMRRTEIRGRATYALADSWGQVLVFLVLGLLLFVVGEGATGREVLVGFSFTILYMLTPIDVILGSIPAWSRAAVATRKLSDLGLSLAEVPAEESASQALLDGSGWSSLEFRGVTYGFESDDERGFRLGPFDLSFEPGETVFLVGGNGSGKTTLAKLLVGLYEPSGGAIVLDGRPVDDETRDAYRQLFSVVFSDFFLFESLLGVESERADERALEYLTKLRLEEKVSVTDGELSTIELSQGQRKRLALLTAYLEDRPIYLFDEWAADQDPEFKAIFYHRLLPELKARGKATFVISHDDRYYGVADRVIEIENGRLRSDRRPASSPVEPAAVAGFAVGGKGPP